MGSCAAPSAKGDDKFITTDYLQQCREKYVDGPEPIPLDDEKSVHERVDNARIDLRSKYYVKPKADHPWLTRRTQSHQQVKPPKLPKKKPDPDKKD
ncbi:hypothetical protein DDJ49_27915 [Klebsiella pneumoniae]|nr:hypothetical protein [Klebsiella pneumoniae subsp. pneumoniae]PXB65583.1 hypothetical protein DL507_25430 [Klebsiella pneumoniae]RFC02380.1 hypothetical protein DDJ49_27915 [Klebsiella pneumoniae]